jgi:hypothetical protein
MTVRVQHESAIIVGVVVGPQPRPTIIAPASSERRRVEGIYRWAIGGAEAKMRTRNWGFDIMFASDRKFNTERAWGRTIVRSAARTEVDDAYEPEWA